MNTKSLEQFEEETGLPAIASRKKLEEMGAVYLSKIPSRDPKTHLLIRTEYLLLRHGPYDYVWKRRSETNATDEGEFKIHGGYVHSVKFREEDATAYSEPKEP